MGERKQQETEAVRRVAGRRRIAAAALAAAVWLGGFAGSMPTTAEAKGESTSGYVKTWTASSGATAYDPTISVLDATADGGAIYGLRDASGETWIEFGRWDASGKKSWSRDISSYAVAATGEHLVAVAQAAGAEARKDVVLAISKRTGQTEHRFEGARIGAERIDAVVPDEKQKRLYLVGGDRLIAASYDGAKLWERAVGIDPQAFKFQAPVLASADRLVTWTTCSGYFACGELRGAYELLTLDPATGETIWSAPEAVRADLPAMSVDAERIVMLGAFENEVMAFRTADGKKLWSYRVEPEDVWVSRDYGAADPDGVVYLQAIGETASGGYATVRTIALGADGSPLWDLRWSAGEFVNLLGLSADGGSLVLEDVSGAHPTWIRVDRAAGKVLSRESRLRVAGSSAAAPASRPISETTYGAVAFDASYTKKTGDPDWTSRLQIRTRNGAPVGDIAVAGRPDVSIGPDQTVYVAESYRVTAYAPSRMTASVAVNGGFPPLTQPAVVQGGTTYVPVRGILEAVGAQVAWDGAARRVDIVAEGKQVTLAIGAGTATVNGAAVPLDAPALMLNGTTMLPLRFVVETLDGAVSWDGASRTVWIEK